jgi:hypothetical protein
MEIVEADPNKNSILAVSLVDAMDPGLAQLNALEVVKQQEFQSPCQGEHLPFHGHETKRTLYGGENKSECVPCGEARRDSPFKDGEEAEDAFARPL